MKKRTKTSMRKEADALFSKLVRSRGICEMCDKRPPEVTLQCAHVVSRRYLSVRFDLGNAFCLCQGCHKWGTEHPLEWDVWVTMQATWTEERLAELKRRAIAGQGAPDYPEILARLKGSVAA